MNTQCLFLYDNHSRFLHNNRKIRIIIPEILLFTSVELIGKSSEKFNLKKMKIEKKTRIKRWKRERERKIDIKCLLRYILPF